MPKDPTVLDFIPTGDDDSTGDDFIKVPKSFKADGVEVTIKDASEYVAMAQKGHNFEKKMTEIIRPNRQVLQILETVPGAKDVLNKHVLEQIKIAEAGKADDTTVVKAGDAASKEDEHDYAGHKRDLRIHFDLNEVQYAEVEQRMVENLKKDLETGKITSEYVDLLDAGPNTYEKEIRRAHVDWKTNKAEEAKKKAGDVNDLPIPPRLMPGGGKDTSFAPDEVTQAGNYIWDLDAKGFEELSNKVRMG